jgi:hypothetical protein
MAIRRITIGLQEEQIQKLDEIRVAAKNPNLDIEFIAGILLTHFSETTLP